MRRGFIVNGLASFFWLGLYLFRENFGNFNKIKLNFKVRLVDDLVGMVLDYYGVIIK